MLYIVYNMLYDIFTHLHGPPSVSLSLRLCCLIPVLPVIYVITTISYGRQLVHELEYKIR